MSEPAKATISSDKLRALTKQSDEWLKRLAAQDYFPKPSRGQYQLNATLAGILRYYQERDEKELPVYDSMAQCAARTGIPLSVLKRVKKAGGKAFKWNRVDLKQFLLDLFSGNEDENWKGHYDKFHALREEIRHDHEKGETLTKGEVSFAISRAISLMFSLLDRQANIELPPDLKGRNERQCQERLLIAVDALKQSLIEGLGELSKNGKTA